MAPPRRTASAGRHATRPEQRAPGPRVPEAPEENGSVPRKRLRLTWSFSQTQTSSLPKLAQGQEEPAAYGKGSSDGVAPAVPPPAAPPAPPKAALDIYGDGDLGSPLLRYMPLVLGGPSSRSLAAKVDVWAVALPSADEDLRKSIEAVLHGAWDGDSDAKLAISTSLGLSVNSMRLRSGNQTSRCEKFRPGARAVVGASSSGEGPWLIWEEARYVAPAPPRDARAVGGLLLRQQGAAGREGGVIHYVAARRQQGGQGWPMVLAAEQICRAQGLARVYSAADLTQDGCGAHAAASPSSALAAHRRWGFAPIPAEEWRSVGLDLYDAKKCSVSYMAKAIT